VLCGLLFHAALNASKSQYPQRQRHTIIILSAHRFMASASAAASSALDRAVSRRRSTTHDRTIQGKKMQRLRGKELSAGHPSAQSQSVASRSRQSPSLLSAA
jgi:hypothetical protein